MTMDLQASDVEPTVAAASKILDRVLVVVDYTMDSHRAVGVALELQRVRGSAVRVFHAAESDASDDWLGGIGSPAVGGDWIVETKGRLGRFLENIAPGSSRAIEIAARVGAPLHTLRREIEAWSPTLVIAAARVHARLVRSPAEHLVHDIAVPVMIIPAHGA